MAFKGLKQIESVQIILEYATQLRLIRVWGQEKVNVFTQASVYVAFKDDRGHEYIDVVI